MNERKKRNIIIGSLCAVVLLMGVGYAAFQTVLNINGTSNITSNWNVKITGITSKNIVGTASNKEEPTFTNTSATFKTNLVSPGDSIEYEVTIKNEGNLNAKLDKITLSDTNNPAIKFTTSGLAEGTVLNAGSTSLLNVKVEFLSAITSTPSSKTSDLTVKLDYSQATGTTPGGETAADKLIKTAVTTGDGLYSDNYENGRYVYKGANPSNYITFNNEVWRIIAVENDGTLKIIREESIDKMPFDILNNRSPLTSTYCTFAENSGCNAWAKVTGNYTNGTDNGTVIENSSLNTYLNTTYFNSLTKDDQNQISYHSFSTAAINRTDNISKMMINEKQISWQGKIGLLNTSDYLKGSNYPSVDSTTPGNSFSLKEENYLYKSGYDYWTLQPNSALNYSVYYVGMLGDINCNDLAGKVINSVAVRPVLFLNSSITVTGAGSIIDPYVIN